MLVSIDPGLRGCGVARWTNGQLVWVRYVKGDPRRDVPIPLVAAQTARLVARACGEPDELAVEWPQVYRLGARAGADPNDLLGLAAVLGALCTTWCANTTTAYKPAEWKGQVPKEVHHARVRLALSQAELAVAEHGAAECGKSLAHNIWDSIGIGLFHLNRTKKGGARAVR